MPLTVPADRRGQARAYLDPKAGEPPTPLQPLPSTRPASTLRPVHPGGCPCFRERLRTLGRGVHPVHPVGLTARTHPSAHVYMGADPPAWVDVSYMYADLHWNVRTPGPVHPPSTLGHPALAAGHRGRRGCPATLFYVIRVRIRARRWSMAEPAPPSTPAPLTLSAHDLRRVAVEACVDVRTVRRRLSGGSQASTTAARIDKALRALGFEASIPRGAGGADAA